ncbi:MAG TPA: SGNH/GDSL hydrolase family protein [Thermoanaerobaculia bacterium]|nr:SGNH/GDSL hydrolase family protein [Thermoanaerobaculia bacterium]
MRIEKVKNQPLTWVYFSILNFQFSILLLGCSSGARPIPHANPPREARTFGSSDHPLQYVVVGDSTAAGEGASSYERGIVEATARNLESRGVVVRNLGVTGARVHDVLNLQLPKLTGLHPDLVLLDVVANDVIHLTSSRSVTRDLASTIDKLLALNCEMKIVVTGSPDMGASPRIPFGLGWLADLRTHQLNVIVRRAVRKHRLTFAPIALKTGPQFRRDRTLFAADLFHPSDRGYEVWIPVLNEAIAEALASQPSHCGR